MGSKMATWGHSVSVAQSQEAPSGCDPLPQLAAEEVMCDTRVGATTVTLGYLRVKYRWHPLSREETRVLQLHLCGRHTPSPSLRPPPQVSLAPCRRGQCEPDPGICRDGDSAPTGLQAPRRGA
jgi:hypothetical protein